MVKGDHYLKSVLKYDRFSFRFIAKAATLIIEHLLIWKVYKNWSRDFREKLRINIHLSPNTTSDILTFLFVIV